MRQLILLATISFLTLQARGQSKEKLLDSLSYFPRSLYSEVGNRIDSMKFIWCSKMLSDFNEPKLISQRENSVYRFTWTRSFHEKMIIRLIISGDTGALITKTEIKKPIQQGKKKSKMVVDNVVTYQIDSVSIGQDTIAKFQILIKDKGFWEMNNTWKISAIHDGAGWLLEANEKERGYKMVYRHSPGQKEQNFADICLFLIRLTRDSEKLEVY